MSLRYWCGSLKLLQMFNASLMKLLQMFSVCVCARACGRARQMIGLCEGNLESPNDSLWSGVSQVLTIEELH